MGINNEMSFDLSISASTFNQERELNLSTELDFFFNNVIDTVADYFKEEIVS